MPKETNWVEIKFKPSTLFSIFSSMISTYVVSIKKRANRRVQIGVAVCEREHVTKRDKKSPFYIKPWG